MEYFAHSGPSSRIWPDLDERTLESRRKAAQWRTLMRRCRRQLVQRTLTKQSRNDSVRTNLNRNVDRMEDALKQLSPPPPIQQQMPTQGLNVFDVCTRRHEGWSLVPRVFSAFNMAAVGRRVLATVLAERETKVEFKHTSCCQATFILEYPYREYPKHS